MKRKLNENDVPEEVSSTASKDNSFSALGLDARLLKTIQREQWSNPTPVQKAFVPLALEGKSILAKSGTGTGKTAAYILPILQSILRRKSEQQSAKHTSALILVPTRELANQVTKVTEALATYADISVVNLTLKEDEKVQRARLADSPGIVVATPGRASINSALSLQNLQHLVIDEADLVLSYDTEDDLKQIAGSGIPTGCQTFFVSATLDPALDTLKELFCRDPVTLELKEDAKAKSAIDQYVVKCGEDTKFLLIYALFMLKLVKGKAIIFVADVDRCYRLKLFLEQFGIRSCILNPELPVNSRIHVVEEFNKNVYDIIIASDDHEVVGGEEQKIKEMEEDEDEAPTTEAEKSTGKTPAAANGSAEDPTEDSYHPPTAKDQETEETPKSTEASAKQPPKKKRKTPKRSKDYGVARGIDFRNVALVLNFDLPTSSKSYTHRIGRTARAGKTGMALSFVISRAEFKKHKATSVASCENDEDVLARIVKTQEKRGLQVKDFVFDMTKLASFQYRINDALKAVTRLSIRQARVRELKSELLKSEKLKRHFEENEDELQHLRHDTESRTAVVQPHLKHVPDYLLPGGQRRNVAQDIGYVGLRGDRSKKPENRRGKKRVRMAAGDPLKTFNAKGRGRGPLKMR